MKEQVEELARRMAACECRTRAVQGLTAASPGAAVPKAPHNTARCRFPSPEHLADARNFLDFIQHDITAAESERSALAEEQTSLWIAFWFFSPTSKSPLKNNHGFHSSTRAPTKQKHRDT